MARGQIRITFDIAGKELKVANKGVEFDEDGNGFKKASSDTDLDNLTKPPVMVTEAAAVQPAKPGGNGGGVCVVVNGRLICP